MPRVSAKPQYINEITRLYLDEKLSLGEISEVVPVSIQTMSRWLTEDGVALEARPRNANAGRTAEQQAEINEKIKATYRAKAKAGIEQRGRSRSVARESRDCAASCGTSFEVRVTSTKKFCSMHCARFDQARRVQEEARTAWDSSEKSLCACGEGRIPNEHRDTWKYCSSECRTVHGGKRRPDPANHVTFVCQNPNCPRDGEPITRPRGYGNGHHKFCSNACARTHTKTRHFSAIEDFDIVFESSWEALFWGLCAFRKLPVERFDREQGVEWQSGSWYAPDFWLPSLELAIEVKGQPDEEDPMRWDKFGRPLVVLGYEEMDVLLKSSNPTAALNRIATIIKP